MVLKILLAGTKERYQYNEPFIDEINKLGIKAKLIIDSEYVVPFPIFRIRKWFSVRNKYDKLIKEFDPDFVVIDFPSNFGLVTIKKNIPLVIRLHGDFWTEIESLKELPHLPIKTRFRLRLSRSIWLKNFHGAKMIFPISNFLS